MANTRFRKICMIILAVSLALCLLAIIWCLCRKRNTPSVPAPSDTERLILYTSLQAKVYEPLVHEFENRTGIWVSVETGNSLSELSHLASGEGSDWDLILGCRASFLESYPELFIPVSALALSNASDLDPDSCAVPFSASAMIIIYNSKLVRLYPPQSWASLLDPIWSGRIAFLDPESTDDGSIALSILCEAAQEGSKYSASEISAQLGGQFFSSTEDLLRSVANGSYCIGVAAEDAALRMVTSGYEITIVYPSEGTCAVLNGAAVRKDCTHQENARQFLDFLLDADIQEYLSTVFCYRSLEEIRTQETEVTP